MNDTEQVRQVVVSGIFDNPGLREVRLLDEASRLGRVHVLLWADQVVQSLRGSPPRFGESERLYVLQALRYTSRCVLVRGDLPADGIPNVEGLQPEIWVFPESEDNPSKRACCSRLGLTCVPIPDRVLSKPREEAPGMAPSPAGKRRVIVTGCFDWLHSGHVRFFEEAARFGELIVGVGHDANIRLLKGADRPMFPQEQRRYMVDAVRHVARALVTTGHGWVDAAPEIEFLRPDIYVVNEDGDNDEKRQYCLKRHIEYLVLRRIPREGLPARSSTALRETAAQNRRIV